MTKRTILVEGKANKEEYESHVDLGGWKSWVSEFVQESEWHSKLRAQTVASFSQHALQNNKHMA